MFWLALLYTTNFFINITKYVNLKLYKDLQLTNINGITWKFDSHISMKKIKKYCPSIASSNFNFQEVTKKDIKKEIINLNVKKSSSNGCIPATILK